MANQMDISVEKQPKTTVGEPVLANEKEKERQVYREIAQMDSFKLLVKKKKKFKEVEVTFGKMLPDQFPNWSQTGYEWVYEEIYGADFSTLIKVMEEGTF